MNNESKIFLSVLLIITALLGTYFIIITPAEWTGKMGSLQAFNDEPAHVNYVRYLMNYGSMPVQKQSVQDDEAFKTFEYEYYQPPLSYRINSFFALLSGMSISSDSVLYLSRIITLLFGLLTVFLAYRFFDGALGAKSVMFAALIFALAPVHIRHTAAFSNDALQWVFLIILYISITAEDSSGGIVRGILEGLILGGAILTKSSALVFVGFYIIMIVANKGDYKRWLIPVIIALTLSSPYFLRNYSLYGEFTGIGMSHGSAVSSLSSLEPFVWYRFFRSMIISAAFPYDTVDIPFTLKLPAYLVWGVIIYGGTFIAVRNIIMKIREINLLKSELIWLLAFSAMLVYNWSHLMVEFRVIYFAFPALIIIWLKLLSNKFPITVIMFLVLAVLYPLLITYLYV